MPDISDLMTKKLGFKYDEVKTNATVPTAVPAVPVLGVQKKSAIFRLMLTVAMVSSASVWLMAER